MIGWLVGGFIALLVLPVAVNLLSKEVEGWLDLVPSMLLRLARRRLPTDQREAMYDEWYAELHAALHRSGDRPLTRLWLAVRFAAGLVLAARRVARELSTSRAAGVEAGNLSSHRPTAGMKLQLINVSPSHADCADPAIAAIRHPGTWVTPRLREIGD